MFQAGILVASDMGSQGKRADTSGQAIRELLPQDFVIVKYAIVPDEEEVITRQLILWTDQSELDLIITTGGTGLGHRDVTPEATLKIIDREVPGIAEAMRIESYKNTPMAMLSRGVVGTRGTTLIINLPGNPNAVRECLPVVNPVLIHAMQLLRGQATHQSGMAPK